jgi:hypothetical protein
MNYTSPLLTDPPATEAFADDLRIAYFGGASDHADNITRLFGANGRKLPAIYDSITWGMYKHAPAALRWWPANAAWKKIVRARSQYSGTHNRAYLAYALDIIDRENSNCLLAYWGAAMLGDLMAIRRHRPHVKIILNCLCHPLGTTHGKVRMQNWHFRRSAHCLDGLVLPSSAMHTYVSEHILEKRTLPTLIWPPCYSREFFPAKRRSAESQQPNVLFLGRMDWYRAQPSDDVRSFIDELLIAGVHVHHHSAEGIPNHPNRHTFEYLPLAQAEEFATAFDAALIHYNLDVCSRTERFDQTVFDRLLAGVAAGIPIAIPARGYRAAKEYLSEYRAVILFNSAKELASRLADRAAMKAMRAQAQEDSSRYIGENRMQPLIGFLNTFSPTRVVNADPAGRSPLFASSAAAL